MISKLLPEAKGKYAKPELRTATIFFARTTLICMALLCLGLWISGDTQGKFEGSVAIFAVPSAIAFIIATCGYYAGG